MRTHTQQYFLFYVIVRRFVAQLTITRSNRGDTSASILLLRRIAIPTVSGLTMVQVADIIRCRSEVNYTILFLKGGQKITVVKTLKEFEELLSDFNFFVCIIRISSITFMKSYNRGKSGSVCMSDDSVIEVASRRKEEFLRRLTG